MLDYKPVLYLLPFAQVEQVYVRNICPNIVNVCLRMMRTSQVFRALFSMEDSDEGDYNSYIVTM